MEDPKMPSLRVIATYSACIYSVMVWDWILNLKREYKYIWRSKPTFVSAVYVVVRYWAIIKFAFTIYLANASMTVAECTPWTKLQLYGNLPILLGIFALLSWRLYAVYGQNRYVLAGLAVCIAAVLAIYIIALHQFGPPPPFINGSGPCFAGTKKGASNIRIAVHLTPFSFDLLCTLLLIARIFVIRSRGGASAGILSILIRDGLVYFGVISCANLLNVGFLLGAELKYQTINAGMAVMVSSIAACRLVLSLRDHAEMEMQSMSNHAVSATNKDGIVTYSRPATGNKAGHGFSKINHDFTSTSQPTHIALNTFGNRGVDKDDMSDEESRGGPLPGVFVITERHTRVETEKV